MTSLIMIVVSSALVSNVVLSQFLGICSFLGVSRQIKTSASLGGAVIFVITIASAVASLLYDYVLVPLNLDYLKTIVFILVIAALVQLVEMFLKKTSRAIYEALGIYLPLITTNCAVLGVALTMYRMVTTCLRVFCVDLVQHLVIPSLLYFWQVSEADWMKKPSRHRSAELRSCFCAQL